MVNKIQSSSNITADCRLNRDGAHLLHVSLIEETEPWDPMTINNELLLLLARELYLPLGFSMTFFLIGNTDNDVGVG